MTWHNFICGIENEAPDTRWKECDPKIRGKVWLRLQKVMNWIRVFIPFWRDRGHLGNYIKSSNILITLKFQISFSHSVGIMAAKAKERGWVNTIKNGRKGEKHVSNPILESQTAAKSSSSSLSSQMKILCSLPPTLSYFQFSLFMQEPRNDSTTR